MTTTEAQTLQDLLVTDDNWRQLGWDGTEIEGFKTVEVIEGDNRRWNVAQTVITQGPSGQHYMWSWDKALTESQEHEYYGEPVVPVESKTRMVEITEWIKQ